MKRVLAIGDERPYSSDPEGALRRGRELGLKARLWMIHAACEDCRILRWVPRRNQPRWCGLCVKKHYEPRPGMADRQRGPGNPSYRDGRVTGGNGYVYLLMQPTDQFWEMANKFGYAMEHRIVVARRLGRALGRREQVHHLNGVRTDNRDENLELWKLRSQPAGLRQSDYHCSGCRCEDIPHD